MNLNRVILVGTLVREATWDDAIACERYRFQLKVEQGDKRMPVTVECIVEGSDALALDPEDKRTIRESRIGDAMVVEGLIGKRHDLKVDMVVLVNRHAVLKKGT